MKAESTIRKAMSRCYALANDGNLCVRAKDEAYGHAVALQWVLERVSWTLPGSVRETQGRHTGDL
jgi:hypothetical protein